ncbi:zinc-binding dehydrogenase [Streptomyces sp. NPDC005202]|uniref:zinc-binding dehydrogenase n=1 Tax=Streptomyces sp. NPDC005202 TaxID=3157021 RepID=UPI0033A206D6
MPPAALPRRHPELPLAPRSPVASSVPPATTRTEEKRLLLDLGAAEVIVSGDGGPKAVAKEVRRITGGKGAEVIFDAIGGPGFRPLAGALAKGGSAVVYGRLACRPAEIPWNWPFTLHHACRPPPPSSTPA